MSAATPTTSHSSHAGSACDGSRQTHRSLPGRPGWPWHVLFSQGPGPGRAIRNRQFIVSCQIPFCFSAAALFLVLLSCSAPLLSPPHAPLFITPLILPSSPLSQDWCFAGVIGSAAQVIRLYSMLVAALAGPASGTPIALKTAVRTPINAGFISTTTLGRHGLFRTRLPKASGAAGM